MVRPQALIAPTWSNWLGNQTCEPRRILQPQTGDALASIVGRAHERGLRVRLVGSGHSWSPLVPTSDVLVRTTGLDRLIAVDGTRITVEPGMQLGTLVRLAEAHGLSVTGCPMIREVSVGGLLATGSHGTGLQYGAIADAIHELVLITGTGERVVLGASDPRMPGARIALGALGAIERVTLDLKPAFNVRIEESWVPLEPALRDLTTLAEQTDFLSFYWLPCTDQAWLFRGWKTDADPDWTPRARLRERLMERALRGWIAPPALSATTRLPSLTAPFLRTANRANQIPHTEVRTSADALHPLRVFPRLWDSCMAVPLADSEAAFRAYVHRVREAASEGRYPINIAVHARFVRGSDAWLSPTAGRDSAFIEAVAAPSTEGVHAFYDGIAGELMDRFDARPHWAKIVPLLDRVPGAYGAQMEAFRGLAAALDPAGTFRNGFVDRLLDYRSA